MTFYKILFTIFAILVASYGFIQPRTEEKSNACQFPNGTDKELHVYNCDSSYAIRVISTYVIDTTTNETMYPIDPRKHTALQWTLNNRGSQYNDIKTNVSLYEYQRDWITGECQWNELPTFGLFSNNSFTQDHAQAWRGVIPLDRKDVR